MQAFVRLQGSAAVLDRDNIDTDVIIRIDRLTGRRRDALGPFAFESWRLRADGSEDPDFVLNRTAFRAAPILVARRNFGCGSSREGAVWALEARGIRCVIAESFGDIFFNNCFQNGVLPIRMDEAAVSRVSRVAADGSPLTVDLAEQRIVLPDGSGIEFSVDPMRRRALLQGLDDIETTLQLDAAITRWQTRDRAARPWVWSRE